MRSATFTTYINAQTDPGLEQAFNRQAQIATSSYATITAAAEKATRATAGLLGARGAVGAAAGTAAITQRAVATRTIVTASAEAERATARLSIATRRQGVDAATTTQRNSALARSLTTTATALNVVQGPLGPLAGRLGAVARAVTELTGVRLGLAAFGATLFAFGRVANEYANLESRVRPFYESQLQANRALDEVIGIAGRSRAALEPVLSLYLKLNSQAKDLGINQSRVGRSVEIANKAATLSGGSSALREAALTQFGQAVGANFRSAGQEFASLADGAPILLQAIAQGFKNVDGSIGTSVANLRKLGEQGKLSTVQVLDALDRAAPKLEQMFARLPKTLATASTEFKNALTVQVGRFDQSFGFTATLAQSLSLIASNLRVVTSLALGVGTAFAAVKLGGLVAETAGAVRAFFTLRAAAEALAQRRQVAAAASLAQHQREVVALAAEQQQIRQLLALETRRQTLARRDISRANNAALAGGPGAARAVAQEDAAIKDLNRSLRQSQVLRQSLTTVTNASVAATARAAASTQSLERATTFVGRRVGVLRGVLGSLVGYLGGPFGIAFAAAATAVYLLATAESAAEKATRQHEDAQRSFAGIIDKTTGKVYDQVDALQKLDIQRKNSADVQTSAGQAMSTRDQIINEIRNVTRPVDTKQFARLAAASGGDPAATAMLQERARRGPQTAAERRLDQAATDFAAGKGGSYIALANAVNDLKDVIPGLGQRLPRILELAGRPSRNGEEGSGFLGAYGRLLQGRAAQRVLRGTAREGDVSRALGEEQMTVTRPGSKPLTKAQIDANARAIAAQTDVERARAELAKTKANGKQAGEDDEAYQNRLAAAYSAVASAVTAQKEARAAASAGRARERKEARDAIQDAKDEAEAKKIAATERLLATNPDTTSKAFLDARLKILKTYDDEMNAIDASSKASNSAARQRLADIEKEEAAAPQRADRRRDVLANYDAAPRAIDRARKQIDDLQELVDHLVDGVEEITTDNPLGRGLYTQAMADADARRINEGLRQPLTEIEREYARFAEVANLQLQGRDAEAAALQRRNSLLDGGLEISDDEYRGLVRNEEQQLRINDALASRQRIVGEINGALDQARSSVETVFTGIQTGGRVDNVLKSALADFQNQFARINSRQLVEKLFGGSDEKLRALLTGKSSVDTAIGKFGTSVDNLSTKAARVETALDRLATATENTAARISGGTSGGGSVDGIAQTTKGIVTGLLSKQPGRPGAGTDGIGYDGESIITGRISKQPTNPLVTSTTPAAKSVYNTIGQSIFAPAAKALDGLVNRVIGRSTKNADGTIIGGSTFFKRIGDSFGTALQGAGTGAIASGFAKALGVKQSATGAKIGGAIGGLTGIPGGDIIGGVLGGTIGGLFKKTKQASSTLSINSAGELVAGAATGVGKDQKATATGLAGSVAQGLQSIAEQLGATVSGAGSVSIGYRPGHKDPAYRVDTTGRGRLTGVQAFATEAEAIQFAISDALKDGVITGISEASKKILASGQDLQKALAKATAIESIPKRLLQLTDPVKYAVSTLNTEFVKLIGYLKEGGATAEQFADAQKLYDLERAAAIEQASQQAADQISQFLKDMVGSSASPLNKRTTYDNAAADLAAFKNDITAGKTVDQSTLLNAARNFQDASRALNGSSQSFFDDFEMLRGLLEKARSNAGITDVSNLPASPFASDSTVQSAIAALQSSSASATQTQTDVLGGKLDKLIDVVGAIPGLGSDSYTDYSGSSVGLLPGFRSSNASYL